MSPEEAPEPMLVPEARAGTPAGCGAIEDLFADAEQIRDSRTPDAAIELYSLIIALPAASADQVARARVRRGRIHRERRRYESARADYTEVIESPSVSPEHRMAALAGRAFLYQKLSDTPRALEDYASVIESAEAASVDLAFALFNRGQLRGEDGDAEGAIADMSRAILLEGVSPSMRASLLNRRAYWYGRRRNWPVEIRDATTVIGMAAQIPASEIMQARLARGACYARLNQFGKAWKDLTCVLKSPTATQYQIIFARFRRILLYGFGGYYSAALADCDQLLRDASLPAGMRVKAYLLKVLLFLRTRLTRRS